jgi:2-succinyl-5-enolpyruvyl-6-hydroxy-3-cyclohexene-1-carboxylate synthase
MIIQPIVDIAEICSRMGIEKAVVSPGSRSAALTLAFARHPHIKTFVIPDERSSGFIALGLAQSTNKAVVVICTSGTAVANLYPAVIEAFYQRTPLIVLTADRPPEWTDQQDGQTIRQQNIYQNHILASYQLPTTYKDSVDTWHANKLVNDAILRATGEIQGPVHINVPFREPFYPSGSEIFHYSKSLRIVQQQIPSRTLALSELENLVDQFKVFRRVLVVAGQAHCSEKLVNALDLIQKNHKWVVLGDIISNMHALPGAIQNHDLILMNKQNKDLLVPDLLLTFGQSVLSKALKEFLRNAGLKTHWHIGADTSLVDAFQSLSRKVILEPEHFFTAVSAAHLPENDVQKDYQKTWLASKNNVEKTLNNFLEETGDGEFLACAKIMEALPDGCQLHLANSMPVRYANYLGLNSKPKVSVWANRGTSGIDGCTSTVVGHALNSSKLQVLITGDVAFFYDRNALWHNDIPQNLRIIILNNHGGGIFRLIDGPKQLNELEEYFETQQKLNAENTAKDFGIRYFSTGSVSKLPELLNTFFSMETGAAILEIESKSKVNQQVFETFRNRFAK